MASWEWRSGPGGEHHLHKKKAVVSCEDSHRNDNNKDEQTTKKEMLWNVQQKIFRFPVARQENEMTDQMRNRQQTRQFWQDTQQHQCSPLAAASTMRCAGLANVVLQHNSEEVRETQVRNLRHNAERDRPTCVCRWAADCAVIPGQR